MQPPLFVRASLALAFATSLANAQPFPSKPIRVVIPFSASGPSDITVRNVAPRMTELLNAPAIVMLALASSRF